MSACSASMLAGGSLWTLARNPDKSDLAAVKNEMIKRIDEVERDLRETQVRALKASTNQEMIKASVERQEKEIVKISTKLDRLIEGKRK